MKTREEAVRFVEKQFEEFSPSATKREKNDRAHFGFQEMRDFLDFIYEGEPQTPEELLINRRPLKW